MIVKNIFGIIAVLVSLVALFSIFNSLGEDISEKKQLSMFHSLSELSSLSCNTISSSRMYNLEFSEIGGKFQIVNTFDNEICIFSLDGDKRTLLTCERFSCPITKPTPAQT